MTLTGVSKRGTQGALARRPVLSPGAQLRGLEPHTKPSPHPWQEHPSGADAVDQRPDHCLRRPHRPARGLPGARGGPRLHLPPAPWGPADPLDIPLWDQVSAAGEEVSPGGQGLGG